MRIWFTPALLAALLMVLPACEPFGITNSDDRRDGEGRDSIRRAYYQDAQQLAVRRMVADTDASVDIPDDRVQPFYDALLAVYSASESSARDSVVSIHTFPRYNLHEIVVGVNEAAEWAAAWQSGERLTGYDPIDDLIQRYDLKLEQYLDFDGKGAAVLRSEEPLNPVGLSMEFEGVTGVRYAEQNAVAGDGDDIRAEVLENAVRLRYTRAWGDCPAGCIHRTTWTFRVHENGTVTFVEKTSN